jgi:hypothetical protein
MWIGNLMLVVINLPMIGIWVQLLRVPYRLLYLGILMFCAIGVYTTNNNPSEVGRSDDLLRSPDQLGAADRRRRAPGAGGAAGDPFQARGGVPGGELALTGACCFILNRHARA